MLTDCLVARRRSEERIEEVPASWGYGKKGNGVLKIVASLLLYNALKLALQEEHFEAVYHLQTFVQYEHDFAD